MDATVKTPQAIASVLSVEGQAFARNPAGGMRALKAGDVLLEGDTIVTLPGGQVQLAFLDGQLLNVLPNETFKLGAEVSATTRPSVGEAALAPSDVERVIQALERGGDIDAELDPAAAGLDGGTNNAGNSFVRLMRIAEGVDPLSFQLDRAQGDTFEVPLNEGLGIVPAAEAAAVPAPAPSATIALSAPSSVTEGGSIVYTATVSSAPLSTPLVITLSNGAVITIPVGALSATSAPIAVRPDDIYVQGTVPVAVSASSATGGGYATLGLGSAVVTNVNDDTDSTTVVLSSATDGTAVSEGGSITYTVTSGALVQGSALVVNLSNGQSITIPVGQSSGTAVFNVRADDIYQQGSETLTAVSISSTSGGNFEAVAASGTVNNTVVDDADTALISIIGPGTVIEGQVSSAYTVSINGAAPTSAVTVALSYSGIAADGSDFTGIANVTIPANSSSATFALSTIDDALVEGAESFTITLGAITGTGGYEAIAVNGAANTVTTSITDNDNPPVAIGNNNTGLEDAVSIPVVLTGTDIDGTVASFSLSSLPANGALYLDAALTLLAATGTDITATGNSLTLYFKPAADFNSTFGGMPSFNFTAKDDGGLVSPVATETITVTAVNDGTPDAVNDSFQTVVGTPITFTRAQLLGNDALFDHAAITATGVLPAGLTYNAGTQTYTYNPAAAGSASFTYTITDDDGQTDTATVSLSTFDSRTDLVTVNESALPDGTGGGVRVVTGNLLTNDAGNTSVTGVTGGVLAGGVYTVTNARGVLQVTASNGNYTYTLNDNVDNDTLAGADTNGYVETFTYTGNATGFGTPINLLVTITDDAPTAQDAIVEVAQGSLPDTNLVFVVDISGSMAGEVKSVDSSGVVTIMNRLDAAKLALISVINEYYSQAGNVSVKLVQFNAGATLLNGGAAYVSKEAAIAAINALAQGGGTNYQDGLQKAMDAFTVDGPVNTAENNTVYFISDGVPTSGDTIDPGASTPGGNGYRDFVNTNGIKSYAIGIASDISNPTELNNIHNVDSDNSGVKDAAIIVTDVGRLDEVLLASVPTAFGGSVAGSTDSSSLNFGADGGFISSLIMKLDTNADNIADTDVAFTYNPGTNQISVVGPFPATGFPLAGGLLTLSAANGFADGVFIFNFSTGEYTYQTAGLAMEGEQFDIKFVATDFDGDTVSGKQTIKIIDGKPKANNDVDSLLGDAAFMEGNVINATGTDDGNNLQLTTFSSGRSGEDNPVDDAQVTSIVFKGVTLDLTTFAGATPAAGGSYTVTAIGGVNTLTWTAATGGASLIFNEEGYYKYTPPAAELSANLAQTAVAYGLTSAALVSTAATAGMTLAGIARTSATEGSAAVNAPNADGVGVVGNTNTRIDSLESLVINFDTGIHPHGVQRVSLFVDTSNSNLGGTDAFNYTVYNIHGDLIGQFASNLESAITMPASYTGIGKIVIDAGGVGAYPGSYGSISSVTYASIVDAAITVNDISVDESAGTATFTVSLSQPSSQTVTVNYATANGTASGADYTTATGTLTFAPGVTTQTVTVAVSNDGDTTANETVFVNLTNAVNAVITDTQGVLTIGNDDTANRTAVLVSNPTVTEGGFAQFTVTFTRTLSAPTTFTLATTAGTATAGTDYAAAIQYSIDNGVTWLNYAAATAFATGSNGFLVRVQTTGDTTVEANETFNLVVTRTAGNAVDATVGGNATIVDNDADTVFEPEIITYTLTDSDGDTSSATLRLNIMTDDIAGTSGNNTITGTARNEFISGLAGDDTLNGGAGFDIIKGGAGIDTIDGGADDDQLYGGDGNDTISGGTGNDEIYGEAGNDTLNGNDGDDKLFGGAGVDEINGGLGADTISGGAGNDTLTGGGVGVDVFKWELADAGAKGTPAADTITDFDPASVALSGDVLDLRDLLAGENHAVGTGNLASYLHFELSGVDTVVHVSSTGGFAAGYTASNEDQSITLAGVDLVGVMNDQQIIADLLTKGKLITD